MAATTVVAPATAAVDSMHLIIYGPDLVTADDAEKEN
jgi:hypothetical protein